MSIEKIGESKMAVDGLEETNELEIEVGSQGYFYSYDMIFDLDISEHAKILYLYLCRRASRGAGSQEKNVSFPSYQTMADACGFSRRTAMRTMKELMQAGLLIKKRQGNGNKQFTNKYMIFSEPKSDLKSKNEKQIRREQDEFRERMGKQGGDCEQPPSDTQSPPSDTQSPPSDTQSPPSDTQSPPSDTQSLPSDRESLEVIHIKGINKYNSSFLPSLLEVFQEEPKELVELVKNVYEDVLNENSASEIFVGGTNLPREKVQEVYQSLGEVHFRQVISYIKTSKVKSVNAIKTALFNSPRYVVLENYSSTVATETASKKKIGHQFTDFPQRKYDYDLLEKKLLSRGS